MKILGIIPARGGSKGVPGKNIKMLNGKPLIQYTFETAVNSKLLSKIILSSENQKIIDIGKRIGIEVPFKRPKRLAQDDTPTLEVIKHAINFYENIGVTFDSICILQPTVLFRYKDLIDRSVNKFKEKDCDSLVTVRNLPHQYNPHWVFEEKNGFLEIVTGEKTIISRRQDLPNAYYRDGSIYLVKTNVVMKQNSLYGEKIGFLENNLSPNINIDNYEDWKKAENFLKTLEQK